MNRRQFLTGTSALAVSAALPVQPQALTLNGIPIEFDTAANTVWFESTPNGATGAFYEMWNRAHRVEMLFDRLYWITGKDNVIHWLDPRDVEIA